jgi:2-polyprenyl-6-methoxyphenol hydroxylase-like FAD-dependent oxidoreductase
LALGDQVIAMKIDIVGGSVTGPALAVMLRGLADVTVYETHTTRIDRAGGIIGLDHLSLDILEGLGIGQDEIVPFASPRVVQIKIAVRAETDRVATIYPGKNTTWRALNGALLERLPDGVVQQGRVTNVSADGLAVDGSTHRPDLVVFADGRNSIGRRVFDPKRKLRYAGYAAHRGNAPWCPPDLRDFVSYRMAHGQFNAYPLPGSAMDWVFYLSHSADEWTQIFGTEPTVAPYGVGTWARAHVDRQADLLLPARQAQAVHDTTTRGVAPVVDIAPPVRAYFDDARAVLLGDALAPVRPHTGRGANNGIQQAAWLAAALRQHVRYDASLDAALRGWQERVLPLVRHDLERGPALATTAGLP